MLLAVVEETKTSNWVIPTMRIPVVDKNHQPLMPTSPSRARRWIDSGKAIKRWADCGQFHVQLTVEPSGRNTQDVVIGVYPGKKFSRIGVDGYRKFDPHRKLKNRTMSIEALMATR